MAASSKVRPSRGHSRRSHSPDGRQLMRFFKIILPCIVEDKKLRIPTKFTRRFGKELSEVAKVTVPSGNAWQIGLTKDDNNIWFDEGWQNFVEHHSIGFGYLLLFTYRGCSNFSVLIFGKSACETNYGERCLFNHGVDMEGKGKSSKRHDASAQQNLEMKRSLRCAAVQESRTSKHFSDKRSAKSVVKEEDPEIIDLEDAAESRKGKLNKHCMSRSCRSLFNETKDKDRNELSEEDSEIIASGFTKASRQSQRAIQSAKMFKPENPSFMVILRPFNQKGFAYVPSGFAKRYMLEVPEYVRLQISKGREWAVRFIWNNYPRLILSKGWNQFYKENNLAEGDVCVFELISIDNSVLKVSLFHVVDYM